MPCLEHWFGYLICELKPKYNIGMTDTTKKGSYVVVTELEFDNLLKPDKGWKKEIKGNEYVYSVTSKRNPNVVVLVYSSLSTDKGTGRKCGADAIRVCAVNTLSNKGIMKSKRVYRTPGWDERVKERVIETLKKIL